MNDQYNPGDIEAKWQQVWQDKQAFRVNEDPTREKFYLLEMFPYPSGRIHMGHVRNYAIGDVVARFKRMQGYNVLHPMGWDAFGMPAENAAIEHGIHPDKWTRENIESMRRQLKRNRPFIRLGARVCHVRQRLLPLGTAGLPEDVRKRACL